MLLFYIRQTYNSGTSLNILREIDNNSTAGTVLGPNLLEVGGIQYLDKRNESQEKKRNRTRILFFL